MNNGLLSLRTNDRPTDLLFSLFLFFISNDFLFLFFPNFFLLLLLLPLLSVTENIPTTDRSIAVKFVVDSGNKNLNQLKKSITMERKKEGKIVY